MKDLLKEQITSLKSERLPDEEIVFRLRSFYGFDPSVRPSIHIKMEGQDDELEAACFIDFEPDDRVAENIHSLYIRQGCNEREIRDHMRDFRAYLQKLDEANEQRLQLAKEAALTAKKKQQRRRIPLSPQRTIIPISLASSASTPALPPSQLNNPLDLASILRKTSQESSPFSPSSQNSSQRVRSPKRRGSFATLNSDLATTSQDGAESTQSVNSPTKDLSPLKSPGADGDSSHKVKRKAPLPWKLHAQGSEEIPVSGAISLDSRESSLKNFHSEGEGCADHSS